MDSSCYTETEVHFSGSLIDVKQINYNISLGEFIRSSDLAPGQQYDGIEQDLATKSGTQNKVTFDYFIIFIIDHGYLYPYLYKI